MYMGPSPSTLLMFLYSVDGIVFLLRWNLDESVLLNKSCPTL